LLTLGVPIFLGVVDVNDACPLILLPNLHKIAHIDLLLIPITSYIIYYDAINVKQYSRFFSGNSTFLGITIILGKKSFRAKKTHLPNGGCAFFKNFRSLSGQKTRHNISGINDSRYSNTTSIFPSRAVESKMKVTSAVPDTFAA
jgi:hypothetical protein